MVPGSLLAAVTGPRGRWVAIVLWTVAAAGCVFLHSRLGDVTAAGQSSFLPASSDSTRAVSQLGSRFGSGDNVPALVVFARAGGLTARDRAVIARLRRRIDADKLAGATPAVNPLAQREARSFLGETCCRWPWWLRLWAGEAVEDSRDFLDGQGIDIVAGEMFGLERGRVNLAGADGTDTLTAALESRTGAAPAPVASV